MSFTYDLSTDTGQVRFELGDTTSGAGVKADGTNFTDEEIQFLLTREGSVTGALAACCELLSRDWQKVAQTETIGPRSFSYGRTADGWATRAQELREKLGGQYVSFAFAPERVDGFSEQADEDGEA